MISAGQTSLPCGTRIKIVESDESDLIGLTGTVTHPFPGLMWPDTHYLIGMRLDKPYHGMFSGDIVNLTSEDEFTPIFCEFDTELKGYVIVGEDLLSERIGMSVYGDMVQQWGAFRGQIGPFVFPTEASCVNCLTEIEKIFNAILY